MGKVWTDIILDDLKAKLVSGLSYAQIAVALNQSHGTVFSRYAVLGKTCRLGLAPMKAGDVKKRPPRESKLRAKPKSVATFIARQYSQPHPTLEVEDADIPASQRKTLLELTNESCRWPIGEVGTIGFFFCGSPTADLSRNVPYCPCHIAESTNRYPRGHGVSDEASVKLRILMRRRFQSKISVGGAAA